MELTTRQRPSSQGPGNKPIEGGESSQPSGLWKAESPRLRRGPGRESPDPGNQEPRLET